MQLAEVMEKDVVTVTPEMTVADAARRLRERSVSAVVVTTDDHKPIGILTERDIVQAVVDGADPLSTLVRDRMTSDIRTLPPDADDDDAADLMAKHGFRHVPVVDGGVVVGIVSLRDRIRARAEAGAAAQRRPAGDFGAAGTITHFTGPYSGGPPAKALEVDTPPIDKFGIAELRRMVVIYVVLTFSLLARLARKLVHPRRETWFAAACNGAIDGFEKLGPTFVKTGQIIASSPGLFPQPLTDAAQRCLDEVPPFAAEAARDMIRKDLGRSPSQVFHSFDDAPLSAASIGQVHACVLPDGREAVIKLQRPNIRERMTTDLRILHRLARTAERHLAFAKNANVVAIIEDLHAVTFSELNPALEAWRQHSFRETIGAFGDNRYITAPEVYWDYCGPHMICMERMSGIPMDEFEVIRERGIDGELVLRRGAKTWLEAVALHGPFHGDMHAGNLWVLDDGRASYLDFGIMGELPPEFRDLIKDLFFTFMIDQDFTRIARAYKRLGVIGEDVGSDEEVGMRLQMVIMPMLGSVGGMSLADFITSALDMMKQYGMQSPKELVLVAKQLLYMERYTKGLAPDWQIATDLYLVKNIFPEEAAAKAAELGITFPD